MVRIGRNAQTRSLPVLAPWSVLPALSSVLLALSSVLPALLSVLPALSSVALAPVATVSAQRHRRSEA